MGQGRAGSSRRARPRLSAIRPEPANKPPPTAASPCQRPRAGADRSCVRRRPFARFPRREPPQTLAGRHPPAPRRPGPGRTPGPTRRDLAAGGIRGHSCASPPTRTLHNKHYARYGQGQPAPPSPASAHRLVRFRQFQRDPVVPVSHPGRDRRSAARHRPNHPQLGVRRGPRSLSGLQAAAGPARPRASRASLERLEPLQGRPGQSRGPQLPPLGHDLVVPHLRDGPAVARGSPPTGRRRARARQRYGPGASPAWACLLQNK
jgi:hypothetical protein